MYVRGKDIQPEGADCEACPLADHSFVGGYGVEGGIAIVLDHPLYPDVAAGRPGTGEVGRILDKLFQDAGLPKEDVYLTTTVQCLPLERGLRRREIDSCNGRLLLELKKIRPKVIIAMGSAAVQSLMKTTSIKSVRGHATYNTDIDTYVVATYSPAMALRTGYFDILHDLKYVANLYNGDTFDPVPTDIQYDVVTQADQLESLLVDKSRKMVVVDVETSSKWELLCVGLAYRVGPAMIVKVVTDEALSDPRTIAYLSGFLKHNIVVNHNTKFDIQHLWKNGIDCTIGGDTMLMHYTMDERTGIHRLEDLVRLYLHVDGYGDAMAGFKTKMEDAPQEEMYKYNAGDVYYTYRLHDFLAKRMNEDNNWLYNNILLPVANTLAVMEYRGVQIDREGIQQLQTTLSQDIENLLKEMFEIAGKEFNPNSNPQLLKLLYEDLDIPIPGRLSTDKEALEMIQNFHPLPAKLLEYRNKKKMLSTYVESLIEKLDGNGRLHGNFNVHGTVTGRLSSSGPNLQNIPSRDNTIKKIFIPTPGYTWVSADYSQAELRCGAYFTQDPKLLEALVSGEDIHTATAALILHKRPEDVTPEERQLGKTLNFAIFYGSGPDTVAKTAGCSRKEAEESIEGWFKTFSVAAEWIEEQKRQALDQGFVTTPLRRFRRFPYITRENRAGIMRQAVNSPVQGMASDLNLLSLVALEEQFLTRDTHLLLTVHDSIEVETRDDVMQVAGIMHDTMVRVAEEQCKGIPFEVEVSIGSSWGTTEVIELARTA